jgi:hypothetical protein
MTGIHIVAQCPQRPSGQKGPEPQAGARTCDIRHPFLSDPFRVELSGQDIGTDRRVTPGVAGSEELPPHRAFKPCLRVKVDAFLRPTRSPQPRRNVSLARGIPRRRRRIRTISRISSANAAPVSSAFLTPRTSPAGDSRRDRPRKVRPSP